MKDQCWNAELRRNSMLTTDQEVKNLISKYYPDGMVYANEYPKIHVKLGIIAYNNLRLYCKSQGYRNAKEWLRTQGMYVDVERDMHEMPIVLSEEQTLKETVKQVFESCALLGNAVLTPRREMQLMEQAQQVFDKLLQGQYRVTDYEQDVLTLAVIQNLKRSHLKEDGDGSEDFWTYIYSQFGFKNGDNSSNVSTHLYAAMREIISSSLNRNQRYFAPEKTKRYFTSLRLHAFAPIESVENLFEILLYFFVNDLHYDYMPGDVAFVAFVNAIAGRWDKDLEHDEEIRTRALNLASGLRILFQERKAYMRRFCERIVCKIDGLLNGRKGELDEQQYLDMLLSAWMEKRGAEIREKMGGYRRERSQTIVDAAAIRLTYAYEHGKVWLNIPAIRLEEKADEYPCLCVLQAGEEKKRIALDVYGRLMWTVRAAALPLQELDVDPDALDTLRIKIEYNGATLYCSDERLQREYLLFDKHGNEISRQRIATGEYYLFAGDRMEIELAEDANCYQLEHMGQLYEIQLDDQSWIRVNGQDLCVPLERKKTFRHRANASKVQGAWAILGGAQYTIYEQRIRMRFDLPEETKSIGYHYAVNGQWKPLNTVCPVWSDHFELDLPGETGAAHCIQFKDILQQRVVYEYRYMILPGFRYTTEKALCMDDGKPIKVRIDMQEGVYSANAYPEENGDEITVSLDEKGYDLRLKFPLVRCSFGDDCAFSLPTMLWHEDVAQDVFVQVTCPQMWRAALLLGAQTVPETAGKCGLYELGNFLRGYRSEQRDERLGLIFHGPDQQMIQVPLTDIVFEEYFEKSPLRMDDKKLLWQPEGKYTGAKDSEFVLEIDVPDGAPFFYALDRKNEIVEKKLPYDSGEFACRVMLRSKSVFAKKQKLLWQETLVVGDPNEWRFDGRYILLKQARCWSMDGDQYEQIPLAESTLMLTDFQYCGMSCPNGEVEDMPEYEAWLSFYDRQIQGWRYFNADKHSGVYEWVNPVHIWLVSDTVMVLLDASGDAVYVDKCYASIVNKTLRIGYDEMRVRLCNPDYLIYKTEEYNDA